MHDAQPVVSCRQRVAAALPARARRARLVVVNGIHDLGGVDGFGRVPHEDDAALHAAWEGRVRSMVGIELVSGLTNVDAFRHAIERIDPRRYFAIGYFGRWLAALEALLVERGALSAAEIEGLPGERVPVSPSDPPPPAGGAAGALRSIDRAPRFATGDAVRARNLHPHGHTRLPRYARGRVGAIDRVHPAFVFPDTNAHGAGENPEHVYAVRFTARELFGEEADARASVCLDLFESYLEPLE
jgi:nitrile hydratase